MIAAQQEIAVLAVFDINQRRAGQGVLDAAKLRNRVHGDDQIGKHRCEHPKHHKAKADHANGAVKQLAIKTKVTLELDRQDKSGDQRNPNRQELLQYAGNNAAPGKCVIHHATSCQPDTGVQIDITDVRNQLCHQNEDNSNHRTSQQQLDVIIAGGLHKGPAEAFVIEQCFNNDHTV